MQLNANANANTNANANANANAKAIYSTRGDMKLGHLIVAVINTEYQAMSNRGVTFAIQTALPIHPFHPVGATVPVITEANRRHIEEVCVLRKYKGACTALKH